MRECLELLEADPGLTQAYQGALHELAQARVLRVQGEAAQGLPVLEPSAAPSCAHDPGARRAMAWGMDNKTYLLRAGTVALLLWGSLLAVLLAGRRPAVDVQPPADALIVERTPAK